MKDGEPDPSPAKRPLVHCPVRHGLIDYQLVPSRVGNTRTRNPMGEQDNAPGGTAIPGQSLLHAQFGYENMVSLRG